MPSEKSQDRLAAVERLAAPGNPFRSALATALGQVRAALEAQRSAAGSDNGASVALGRFAAGRVDAERFTSLLTRTELLDAQSVARIEAAYEVLASLAAEKDQLFRCRVEPGASPGAAVGEALARVGRAFGAARVFELAKSGRYRESEHSGLMESFGFERWNKAERMIAPPLVVSVAGADLHAGEVARFLDGSLKILFLVEGEAPLAPLVRLITPRTFVLQSTDGGGIDRLAAWEGPGVAALLPEGCATFVHDPAAGPTFADRVLIGHLPDGPPPIRVGGRSARQQSEELDQLRALTAPPLAGADRGETQADASPVDKLAAWLIRQSDLGDVA